MSEAGETVATPKASFASTFLSLRNVSALIGAVGLMQASQGLIGAQLPLAMRHDGLGGGAIGFVAALYSAGFMAGAWYGPMLLARVGHIRAFSATSALISVCTLALYAAGEPISWGLLRALMGGAVALLFVAADSWISSDLAKEQRGGVMGVYQVVGKAAMAIGPFLAFGLAPESAAPLMVAAALQGLALVPVAVTTQAQPTPPRAVSLAIRAQFEAAPVAVVAAFIAGFTNSGVLGLAPLYAAEHFGVREAAAFQSAAWFGSLLSQWPAGRISDRVDRRIVIAALAGLAALSAILLGVIGGAVGFAISMLLFAFWGAGALSFYPIGVAHMADRSEADRVVQGAAGLLFVYAIGSILGPVVLGVAVEATVSTNALFWIAALPSAAMVAFVVHRRRAREETERDQKGQFAANSATSVAAAEITYGAEPEPPPAEKPA
jgi:MFS family permease